MTASDPPAHGKVLVTGFEPFGGDDINPSWDIARALEGIRLLDGTTVLALQLPCAFDRVQEVLSRAIEQHRPQLVLALGLAGSRTELSVERVALNLCDARIADNDGLQPMDQPVIPDGPLACMCLLPVKRMAQSMRDAGAPAAVSYSAGTFVCNQLFYLLLHGARTRWPGLRAGFIHVPGRPGQRSITARGFEGLALDVQIRAVAAALQTAWSQTDDAPMEGGPTD
jgi:pyroglutamyl-peptidase